MNDFPFKREPESGSLSLVNYILYEKGDIMPHSPIRDTKREHNIESSEIKTYKLSEEELKRYREDYTPVHDHHAEDSNVDEADQYLIRSRMGRKYPHKMHL